MPDFKPGDLVQVESRPLERWIVNRISQVNTTLDPANPDGTPRPGRGLRAPNYAITKAEKQAPGSIGVPFVPWRDPMVQGTVVRYRKPDGARSQRNSPVNGGFYVVQTDDGTKATILRLGGGDAWRGVLPSCLTVIPVAELAAALGTVTA